MGEGFLSVVLEFLWDTHVRFVGKRFFSTLLFPLFGQFNQDLFVDGTCVDR